MRNADGAARPENKRTEAPAKLIRGERHCIARGKAGYPAAFAGIPRPPAQLYVVGSLQALSEGIAIIGARKATPYGRGCARHFARMAAEQGVCVISGGALGCDSEAHRGALEAAGRTVVFLGGGCDRVYPARNLPLFQEIVDAGGAIVSEQDWETPPLPWMFRERNRLIAGLAKATLVIEAGLPSGTFGTADDALAAGKDVLAVPSAITSATSAGANRLIAQGAVPIIDDESFESALTLLFGTLRREAPANRLSAASDNPLLAALMAAPMRTDELMNEGFAQSPAHLALSLAHLENAGFIERYPDGRYGPSQAFIQNGAASGTR